MKTYYAIVVLSLFTWVVVSIITQKPNPIESAIIVGICAGVIYFMKWLWGSVVKRRNVRE